MSTINELTPAVVQCTERPEEQAAATSLVVERAMLDNTVKSTFYKSLEVIHLAVRIVLQRKEPQAEQALQMLKRPY